MEQPAPALSTRAKVLARNPLFGGLPAPEIEALAAFAAERAMRKDEVLFRRGDPGTGMMAVLAGQVRIVLPGAGGRDRVLKIIGQGELFGEIALLDGQPRTADAVAVTNGRLLVLERRDVMNRIRAAPDLGLRLIELLCERLRATNKHVEALVFQDIATRLATALLRLTNDHPRRLVDITQRELGELVDATRESVNKRLREWEEQGVVALSPGRVTVLKPEALLAIVPEGAV
jgi:CRP-like cAMP-binding protein